MAAANPNSKLPSGVEVGKRVLRFLRALDPDLSYRILTTEKRVFAWEIGYEVAAKGQPARKRAAFVSMDGRYMSNQVVDIVERLARFREAQKIGRCLREKDVRVYLDPSEEASRKQLTELGLTAQHVVIDCGGERKVLCKRLGHESFPEIAWRGGGEIGVRQLDWIQLKVDCR